MRSAVHVPDAPSFACDVVERPRSARGPGAPRTAPLHVLARAVRCVRDESGSATAEYAVATMAAVGFAGLLVVILRGDEVRGVLTDLVRRALSVDL